jgi:predicted nucleotidyltransferase component of viral defense system
MLIKASDIMLWNEIIDKSDIMGARRKQVLAEEMQKAVLTALSLRGCFDSIVVHGGTALRLFHGNPRFSEDIDMVLVEGVDTFELASHMPYVGRYAEDTFPFLDSVETRAQRDDPELQRYILRTLSDDHEQIVRVHIELAPVPSHRNGPRILDFPPIQPAIRVEDTVEILADKVCALAFRQYLKGRDLWDIHYLSEERSIRVEWELVRRKAGDYGESVSGLVSGLERSSERIREEGMSTLESELVRFLPPRVMEEYRPSLEAILEKVLGVISDASEHVGAGKR